MLRPREARQADRQTATQVSGQTKTDDDTDIRHKQIQLDTQADADGRTDRHRQTDRQMATQLAR